MGLMRCGGAHGLLVGLALVVAGCTGGIRQAGEHQVRLTGGFGTAIKGDIVWPDGKGQADNWGVTVDYGYFVRDRLALLVAGSPYRQYSQPNGRVGAAELQIGLRYYFFDFELGAVPVGLYAEALGGMLYGAESIPEDGSHTNFTQDTGVGFEAVLSDTVSWVGGYRLRHLSNGRLFGDDTNPSQNDNHFYTGVAITFP